MAVRRIRISQRAGAYPCVCGQCHKSFGEFWQHFTTCQFATKSLNAHATILGHSRKNRPSHAETIAKLAIAGVCSPIGRRKNAFRGGTARNV